MAFRFDVVPDAFDFPIRTDEERASNDAEERTAEKCFHAARAVSFDRFQIGIAEKIEVEFKFRFERGLGFHRVAAHAEDDHAKLVKLLFCVAKLGRFDGSTGSIGFRVEKEQDALAAEVGEGDVVAGVVLQSECGGFVAYFEHVFTFAIRNAVTEISGLSSNLINNDEDAGLKPGATPHHAVRRAITLEASARCR